MSQNKRFESRSRARRRALQALYQWQITGQEPGDILAQFRAVQDMKGVDEAYFETLLRGVVAGQERLDEALGAFLDRPMVLRIGAYEMLNCPDLPFRVVIDECVDLAHRFGSEQGHSYVNAVLDKAARQWRSSEASQQRES